MTTEKQRLLDQRTALALGKELAPRMAWRVTKYGARGELGWGGPHEIVMYLERAKGGAWDALGMTAIQKVDRLGTWRHAQDADAATALSALCEAWPLSHKPWEDA